MSAPAVPLPDTRDRRRGRWFTALAFAGPLALYLATMSDALALDDAAQFALCAREWSPAHPPGFPVFVGLAHLWLMVAAGLGTATALAALAGVLGASAIALLYRTFEATLAGLAIARPRAQLAALLAALGCAAGATVWQWSNAVEVYSLQLFATALTLLGIASSAGSRRRHLLAGIGIGIGLANHHVATVVLVPFLVPVVARLRGIGLAAAARGLLPALGIALGVAVLAYGALAVSAADANAFQFGEPDTPARLWHHLRGGFFADSLWRDGVDYGGRAEVLFTVLARHLVAFAIPAALGVAIAWRRARALLWLGLGYPVALFALQLGRMHTPNMDAGLLPALATLGVPVALGLAAFRGRWPLWFGLAALALQLAVNFAAADRRGYAPGRAVLADLEASMPPRAIALVSSWELLTLSRLAIEADGFRPDAIVVPASLKGTHRDLLARHYPEFHAAVRTEYEAWLDAIAALDPDWVYTDFFELRDAATTASYAALARKVLAVGAADDRPVVCDRETVRLLLRAGIVTDTAVTPCGRLFALGREVASPPPFPLAPGWLDHSFLMHDLCALGTLHDYKTTAAQIAGYYRHRGRRELAAAAETARDRLDSLWLHYLAGKPAPRRP